MHILSGPFYRAHSIEPIPSSASHQAHSIERIPSSEFHVPLCKFHLQVPSCKFYRADSIVRILSCGFHRSIVRIPSCKFYYADSIVRIPSCGFHRADSIIRVPLYTSIQLHLEVFCANATMRIPLYAFCYMPIVCIASCAFYCSIPSYDRWRKEEVKEDGRWVLGALYSHLYEYLRCRWP